MRKRVLSAVALFLLAAMAFHGVSHAAVIDDDSCAACSTAAARVGAAPVPAVASVSLPSSAVPSLPTPAEAPARAPLPVARPPPRG